MAHHTQTPPAAALAPADHETTLPFRQDSQAYSRTIVQRAEKSVKGSFRLSSRLELETARIFVTGATGFIGQTVVKQLLQSGHEVRCLVHRAGLPAQMTAAGAKAVRGSLLDPASLQEAVADADYVVHLGGSTRVLHPRDYQANNALGTKNLAQACANCATPPIVVYMSSLAAAGPAMYDLPRTEEQAPAPVSAYGQSKLQAEQHLREVAQHVPITILRPPGVFGPWDPNLLPLFQSVRWHLNIVPGGSDLKLSLIHVEDLADAVVLACARGRRLLAQGHAQQGLYYVALDEQPSLAELGRLAGKLMHNGRVCTFTMPRLLCRLFGIWNDWQSRLLRKPALLTSDKMREATAGSWLCSSDKAKRELGFACQHDLASALSETLAWYRAEGWV